MRTVETVLFMVVLATVVATFARRLRIPAPSLLVIAGVLVGLFPGVAGAVVSPNVVSLIILPPLLFSAGEELAWRDLRAVWRPVTALAVGLVLMSAAALGVVAMALTRLSPGMAFVLGAVLASTDPVAVTALGRRLALPPRIQALVQAESLFNDATSLLLFRLAVSVAVAAGALSWSHALTDFVILAGGGVLAGLIIAGGAFLIHRRTENAVLETVIALATPYAAYVLAEETHGSGVTAVVVASVVLNSQTTRLTSAPTRLQLNAVYDTVVFVLESVVFGIIGLELPALVRGVTGGGLWPLYALALAATGIVVRFLWVFPVSAMSSRDSGQHPWPVATVVSWAGARGVVPLAAALSIPLSTPAGTPLAGRNLVLLLTIAVTVLTLIVQGFTLAPMVRRSGITLDAQDVAREQIAARLLLARTGLAHLDEMMRFENTPEPVMEQLRRSWEARIHRIQTHESAESSPSSATLAYRQLRRHLITIESNELNRLYEAGMVTDAIRRRIQHQLDLEHATVSDEDPR